MMSLLTTKQVFPSSLRRYRELVYSQHNCMGISNSLRVFPNQITGYCALLISNNTLYCYTFFSVSVLPVCVGFYSITTNISYCLSNTSKKKISGIVEGGKYFRFCLFSCYLLGFSNFQIFCCFKLFSSISVYWHFLSNFVIFD